MLVAAESVYFTPMKTPILVLVILLAASLSAAANSSSAPGAKATATSPAAVEKPAAMDTLWIDVRTPGEFANSHLPQAVNVPLDQLEQQLPLIQKERGWPIALYCRSGNRSGRALMIVQQLGYTAVRNAGGLRDVGL